MIINIDGFEYQITDGSIIMDRDPRLMFEDRGNIKNDDDVADAHDHGHIIVSKNWLRCHPVKMMKCVCMKGLLYPHGSYDGNKIRYCNSCMSHYQQDRVSKGWVRIVEPKWRSAEITDFETSVNNGKNIDFDRVELVNEFASKIGDAADKFRMKNTGCKAIDKCRLTNWSNPSKEVKTTFLRKMRCEDGFVRMLEFEFLNNKDSNGKVRVIKLQKNVCSDIILGEDICIIERGFGLYSGEVLRLQKYNGTEAAEMSRYVIANSTGYPMEMNNHKIIEHREPNRKNSRKSHPKKINNRINFLTIDHEKEKGFVLPRIEMDMLFPGMKPKEQIKTVADMFGVRLEFYPAQDTFDDVFGCLYTEDSQIDKLVDELVAKKIWNRA